jgi:hypothetical protein
LYFSVPVTPRKRLAASPGVNVLFKKPRLCPRLETDLNGSHIILTMDVSGENSTDIEVPQSFKDELDSNMTRMSEIRIQFGVSALFSKEDGTLKEWAFSNDAREYNNEFLEKGVQDLKEKIAVYSGLSSGWCLLVITKVNRAIWYKQASMFREYIDI